MLSTLLATKLHRPRPTSHLVARPRLTEHLEEGLRRGHRLFLVVAPAGYGKTTLVTEWLDRTGLPAAWLSLDEADNDPLRFFTYVTAALQQTVDLDLGGPVAEAFPMAPQSPEAWVQPLINDLAAVERPILLALDDYHVISAPAVQEAMVLLLRRGPPNLHLVVLSRADPPFPLPRLRVRERMTEIRDRDLRFTPEEMTAFLNSLHRLNLAAEQIAALEARTEGWAAGVQLAALSLQGYSAERAAQFIAAFSGSHHYIVDYLFDEVLDRQTDPVREFLLHTSILDRMCAPLCDAVLGWGATGQGSTRDLGEALCTTVQHLGDGFSLRSQAQEILEYLERSNLFLIPLDEERCWYRYHHLFIDVLRQMLSSSWQPEQVARLHDRAGEWYGQHGLVADAYSHALQAGNHERAADILEENAWSIVLRAEFATLKKWIQALPADLLTRHPWLRIHYAWAVMFGEPEEAEGQLAAVEQRLQAGDTGQTPLRAEMQGHIAAIRAWIACLSGDLDRAVVLSHQALELWPQMEAAVRSGLIAILGVGCRTQNDLTGAARSFAESVELAQCSGNVMLEVVGHTSLGRVSEMMGCLHEAEALYREGLDRAIGHKSPAAGQAYRFLANVHREWNDLESARLLAEKSIEPSRMWGHANPLVEGLLTLARIHQAQNNIPEANRALTEVSQAIQGQLLEATTIQWIGAIRARLWLAQGKVDDARGWAEARGLSAEAKLDLENEVEYLTLVRILLAEGRADEARRLLARLQSAAESTGRQGSLIEVLVLQAVALAMQADSDAALAVLEQTMGLARPEGYMRMFLDEGQPIVTLLRIGITKWNKDDLVAYARQLLAAFYADGAERPVSRAATAQAEPLVEPLSERELEVLHLMAAGWSNREIADRLVISVRTVKKHVENIHGKLGVSNRTQAAARARDLKLL